MKNREFLTQRELTKRWKLHVRLLSHWRYLNKGPSYIKIEGTILYPLDEIIKWEALDSDKKEDDELYH